ncbi:MULTISPECIES: hypothetical protein [unclassified Chelatococcus]|uniref:hypothetical protein n=1 Tax=unclassified Chelatococcus TaxID=2638111 RepID=UPI001BCF11DB|nr:MULTISPECIES: hypothetical protein [unclassified Chelatococcus]MBS7701021.1 hypothetical protein [Chelatococcus sp. YT9]MBX3555554.1 hypothetical protein [Chelatococcus sp.]
MFGIDPFVAAGVVLATGATDAAYVFFNAAVGARHRVRAANWSAIWYMLSAFAVISYTEHAIYVLFAAIGSWIGAFVSVTWLIRAPIARPVAVPEA